MCSDLQREKESFRAMTYRILFQSFGKSQILEVMAKPPCIIGRSLASDIILCDMSVSRRHARLTERDGKLHIEDLHATNGVLVNGIPVQCAALTPADIVLLGNCVVQLAPLDAAIDARECALVES
jgi:pSer/pThr/pTyr-binding forkhead associated (FHA) protein